MIKYQDVSGRSGVEAYNYGSDFIEIKFKSGRTYKYTYRSSGVANVDTMKRLAVHGEDLNTYINKNVRANFESHD